MAAFFVAARWDAEPHDLLDFPRFTPLQHQPENRFY
jgi:hypothetical protein